jgi:hypothetical protein
MCTNYVLGVNIKSNNKNKKHQIIGIIPKSNRKIVETECMAYYRNFNKKWRG